MSIADGRLATDYYDHISRLNRSHGNHESPDKWRCLVSKTTLDGGRQESASRIDVVTARTPGQVLELRCKNVDPSLGSNLFFFSMLLGRTPSLHERR